MVIDGDLAARARADDVSFLALFVDLAGKPCAKLVPADVRDTAPQPCYDARGLTRMYDRLTEVSPR